MQIINYSGTMVVIGLPGTGKTDSLINALGLVLTYIYMSAFIFFFLSKCAPLGKTRIKKVSRPLRCCSPLWVSGPCLFRLRIVETDLTIFFPPNFWAKRAVFFLANIVF